MASILINGAPFEYPEENLTHDNIRPITPEEAFKILELTKELFDEKGIKFFLFWGTLLGAVRDKGIIPGDEDVDCGILDEKALVSNIPYFYDRGLKIIRHLPGKLYSFRSNDDCYIDFYVVRPLHRSLWSLWCCHAGSYVMEKKHFKRFKEIDFLGGRYLVPANTDAMLVRLYGKTWRIPQKGHLWHSDVMSHYIWTYYIKPYSIHYIGNVLGWKYWRPLPKGMTRQEYIKKRDSDWIKTLNNLKQRKK